MVSILTRIYNRLRQFNHHRTTEVFFVGYPKTGNTWARFLIGRYCQLLCEMPELPLFDSCDSLGRCERACVGPSMHFTHRPLVWSHQTAADLTFTSVIRPFLQKKIVLITRYPLDALVSSWFQFRYRGEANYHGDLLTFLEDPVLGLEKLITFHNVWARWKDATKGILLLRYEDMSLDTGGQLQRLLDFLDIDVNLFIVNEAVEYASFNNMKKIEMSGKGPRYKSSGLNVFATGDAEDPNAHHLRRGIVGGYKDHLNSDLWKEYEAQIASKMHSFYGYCNFSQSY